MNLQTINIYKQTKQGRPPRTDKETRIKYKSVFDCLDKLMSLSQVKAVTGVNICTISNLRKKYY